MYNDFQKTKILHIKSSWAWAYREEGESSVHSLSGVAQPLADGRHSLLLEGQGGLVPLGDALVDFGLVLPYQRLNQRLVQLAGAFEPRQEEPHQEPELEDRVQGDPRDQEAPAELDDGEEGEDDPCEREKSSSEVRVGREGGRKLGVAGGGGSRLTVGQPLRGRVQAVGFQSLRRERERETRDKAMVSATPWCARGG